MGNKLEEADRVAGMTESELEAWVEDDIEAAAAELRELAARVVALDTVARRLLVASNAGYESIKKVRALHLVGHAD